MIILYETDDKSLKIELEYIQGHPLKYTHLGKTWAKETQVILRINGFVRGVESVTKHNKDIDNINYAVIKVTNKVLGNIHNKWIRTEIWNKVFETIKKPREI